MAFNEGSSLSIQPDLQEFLTALSGFLGKQSVPTDPGHLRFLEIFFRTVKSDKGHLLRITEGGRLESVVSTGLGPDFDQAFNKAVAASNGEPSPLDMAFRAKEPIAVVDIVRDPDIPVWFSKLMKTHQFASLVAVPLMGATEPIGILCAYYHDVCLFDRATLSHLMMIGRMVGGASERSLAAEQAVSHGAQEKTADQFLRVLVAKELTKIQIYTLLAKIVTEALPVAGLVCGPVTKTSRGLNLTVAAGARLPSTAPSSQVVLPDFLAKRFLKGILTVEGEKRSASDWGELKSLVNLDASVEASSALIWRNTIVGAIVAWRTGSDRFSDDEALLLNRLACIATLALHSVI